ncbi:MAG: N-acetyl-gamma-glutamyl-phosphate reductase [Proteobacteria bacterium]|nr:N-acetyl-gamma-glutamyl-phosphate reductase [Pseudomonadota bacterium]
MTAKIFIDGEAGTTGLQIKARLEGRGDIELLHLPESERKNVDARREFLNAADLAILCLPDDAAREAVALIENPATRVIDSSTAHRTASGWVYGFPEYQAGQRGLIANAKRVANPGCYAIASIACLHPLVSGGLIQPDWPVTINAVSGYSGGGKSLIAEYEDGSRGASSGPPFFTYGHSLSHKHVPEITRWSGLSHAPVFMPSVGRFAQGMIVQLPLPLWSMPGSLTPADIHGALAAHYAGERCVRVAALDAGRKLPRLEPEALNGTNELALTVFASEDGSQAVVTALLDNLGKGASGQAVQNLNLMLGFPELAGLQE